MATAHSERTRSGDPEHLQTTPVPPVLAEPAPVDDEDAAALRVRRFHLGGLETNPADLPPDLLPALLHRFRGATVRGDYPLFLAPGGEASADPVCLPLPELLERAGSVLDDGARILRENLRRLERKLRETIAAAGPESDAAQIFAESARRLAAELTLGNEDRTRLEEDLRTLGAALPADGIFLQYHKQIDARLMTHVARAHLGPRRRAFQAETRRLAQDLRAMLKVDAVKQTGDRPDAVGDSMGAAELLDASTLAGVLGPHRGTRSMNAARRARIDHAATVLESFAAIEDLPILVWIAEEPVLVPERDTVAIPTDDPSATALGRFEEEAGQFAEVFRSIRIARLELSNDYDEDRHGPWLAAFDWEAFSREELHLLPMIVAVETPTRLAGEGMPRLSRLLLSGRPVHVLVRVHPERDPALQDGRQSDFRLELGYFGIGHRDAQVLQSTSARPVHFLAGVSSALEGVRAALHVLAIDPVADGLDPWLTAGAALEARAHPLFHYDPEAGISWAHRLRFDGNPDTEADWPTTMLEYGPKDDLRQMDLAFTFADFALLAPDAGHFHVVPAGFPEDDLIPIAAYLELSREEAEHRVPFVWAVDREGRMHRLAITRRLAAVAKNRLEFWRTLQELAGIRNEHVRAAVARALDTARREADAERARMEDAHARELAETREQATEEGLAGLASFLLGLDATDLLAGASAAPTTTTRPAAAPAAPAPADVPAAEPAVEAVPEPEEEEASAEAWIDSVLCTSCNDCMAINPKLFVYDGNKQARIGDVHAGTFEQLVMAAEKCPARCIHPGEPVDPSEPDLEDLRQRAKQFN
ncbi:MAG: ferredoxin [Candidatus Eisenbacteria bacterium]|uniref:Ferredoxin n=1 Tax=Eiseniibacteriota bacterium TaxID=2212470 RepID=A0A956LVF3_UNCEI|nr:ferredoxin [Candidatus Eisenbacteria bacterium]